LGTSASSFARNQSSNLAQQILPKHQSMGETIGSFAGSENCALTESDLYELL